MIFRTAGFQPAHGGARTSRSAHHHDADLEVRAPKSMSRLEAGGPEDY